MAGWCTALLFVAFHAVPSHGIALTMQSIFADGMVLQHDEPRIAGRASKGAKVSVQDGLKTLTVTADASGRFVAELTARNPSMNNVTITVTAGKTTVKAVALFGTVIFCGGQSNMAFGVGNEFNSTEDLAEATEKKWPTIRLWSYKGGIGAGSVHNFTEPQYDVVSRFKDVWSNVSPDAVKGFSAVCWNMGKTIAMDKSMANHPLALVHVAVGSTKAECWMTPFALQMCKSYYTGKPSQKGAPNDGHCQHVSWELPTSSFYNGLINPFAHGSTGAAFVYYQGENNMWDSIDTYNCSVNALAAGTRRAFAQRRPLAWVEVQLAPCCGNNYDLFAGSNIREAQRRAVLSIPQPAGLAALQDLGEAGTNPKMSFWGPQTHPRFKIPAGHRVGLQVLKLLKKDPNPSPSADGPVFASAVQKGAMLTLSFANSGGMHWDQTTNCTVYAKPCCQPATEFVQLSNASTAPDTRSAVDGWTNVTARIVSGDLVANVPAQVGRAQWVRMGFMSQPPCVLRNRAGIPASLFQAAVSVSSDSDAIVV